MAKLKAFGAGGMSHDAGYDLPMLAGHVRGLIDDEASTLNDSGRGPRWKRLEMVEKAAELLDAAIEMGNEEL